MLSPFSDMQNFWEASIFGAWAHDYFVQTQNMFFSKKPFSSFVTIHIIIYFTMSISLRSTMFLRVGIHPYAF